MLVQQVTTAGGAFAATNVDDIVILSLLFARLSHWRLALPLVLGKTLGFSLLVLISLLGLFGQRLLVAPWPGLLGLLPILLGLWRWQQQRQGDREAAPGSGLSEASATAPLAGLLAMAGLTVANGADNIGVYLPLFAQSGRLDLVVILITFAVGLVLFTAAAWACSRTPGLAALLGRLGDALVPAVLIGLGVVILLQAIPAD